MTNWLSRSLEANYVSVKWHKSRTKAGVEFATHRLSLAQRIRLVERLRNLTANHEFLQAGNSLERMEATLADLLSEKVYLEWGLAEIKGLLINGVVADTQSLIEYGPADLAEEMVQAIRQTIELSEEERKNS